MIFMTIKIKTFLIFYPKMYNYFTTIFVIYLLVLANGDDLAAGKLLVENFLNVFNKNGSFLKENASSQTEKVLESLPLICNKTTVKNNCLSGSDGPSKADFKEPIINIRLKIKLKDKENTKNILQSEKLQLKNSVDTDQEDLLLEIFLAQITKLYKSSHNFTIAIKLSTDITLGDLIDKEENKVLKRSVNKISKKSVNATTKFSRKTYDTLKKIFANIKDIYKNRSLEAVTSDSNKKDATKTGGKNSEDVESSTKNSLQTASNNQSEKTFLNTMLVEIGNSSLPHEQLKLNMDNNTSTDRNVTVPPASSVKNNSTSILAEHILRKRRILFYNGIQKESSFKKFKFGDFDFLNDLQQQETNTKTENNHIHKRVKKDLSSILQKQSQKARDKMNNVDKFKIDTPFSKLRIPMPFHLPKIMRKIDKKKITSPFNTRSSDSFSIIKLETNFLDYLLGGMLLATNTPLRGTPFEEKIPLIDDQIILKATVNNEDVSSPENGDYLESTVHKITRKNDNKKHMKHKRNSLSKDILTTAKPIKIDKNYEEIPAVDFLFNYDDFKGIVDKEYVEKEKPSKDNVNNQKVTIFFERSLRKKGRNSLLSTTVPSIACLLLSLGFLCYFLHKRKCLSRTLINQSEGHPYKKEITSNETKTHQEILTNIEDEEIIFKSKNFIV